MSYVHSKKKARKEKALIFFLTHEHSPLFGKHVGNRAVMSVAAI